MIPLLPSSPLPDRTLTAIGLILSAAFLIAIMNASAKFLGGTYHPVELVFYRNIPILAVLCAYLQITDQWRILKTTRPMAHLWRAAVGTAGVGFGFWAVQLLPLAEATTLIYTAPLLVTALSVPMLGEKVGPLRWAAVAAGFGGIVLIAQPGGHSVSLFAVAVGLLAALFYGLTQITLRSIGKTEAPVTTVFYFMLFGTIGTGILTPFVSTGGTGPKFEDIWLFLLLAAAGGGQQILKTRGYALAPVSTLTGFNYTGLVWAALFGWAIWGEVPALLVACGAAMIVGSNLFIAWREGQARKKLTESEGPLS